MEESARDRKNCSETRVGVTRMKADGECRLRAQRKPSDSYSGRIADLPRQQLVEHERDVGRLVHDVFYEIRRRLGVIRMRKGGRCNDVSRPREVIEQSLELAWMPPEAMSEDDQGSALSVVR